MAEEFEDVVYKKVNFNFEERHLAFLKTLKNKSHFLRWLIDNSEEFQKFKKEKK